MKKVLLVASHGLHAVETQVLEKMYGEIALTSYIGDATQAEQVVNDYKKGGYSDLVVIAPYSVIDRMCQLGVRPLWPEAVTVLSKEPWDWQVRDRYYCFLRFKRAAGFKLQFEELGPEAKRLAADKPELATMVGSGPTVLWVCQFPMEGIQVPALKRLYGQGARIKHYAQRFANAEQLEAYYRSGNYADMIAVVPYAVLERLSKLGLQPLWSDAEKVGPEKADWSCKGNHFRFLGYKRVKGFEMAFEDLGPKAARD